MILKRDSQHRTLCTLLLDSDSAGVRDACARLRQIAPFSREVDAQFAALATLKADVERDARAQFDNENAAHVENLRALFFAATGVDVDERFGSHWGQIGFQGKDPATDLRGMGLLGLNQMLSFARGNVFFYKYFFLSI